MPNSATPLSLLKDNIKTLPKLVVETKEHLPAAQQRKFAAQVETVVSKSVRAIENNVANIEAGRLLKMRRKIAGEAERVDSSGAELLHLINLLGLTEKHVNPQSRSAVETTVTAIVRKCIRSLTKQVDELQLKGDGAIKKDWHALRAKIEAVWRELELLHPSSEEDFIKSAWWMSQQGQIKHLDLLFKVKVNLPFSSTEVLRVVNESEQKIVERECGKLLDFFSLKPAQLVRGIEATIEKCRTVTSPYLKKAFNAERPTQVIVRLREAKRILEDLFEPPRIEQWLNSPLALFDGQSPREALLLGYTFPLLHLLKRFDEGPHY